ncbi:MAG: DUF2244 domain-containing protein [Casimicrobiaceae bacterium]
MPDAALPPPSIDLERAEFCVVARRFGALPTRQRWLFFGILAGFSLGVGLTMTVIGAWPVLPYSLVETGVLAGAFWYVERRSRDWERLTVVADRVILERVWNGHHQKHEFNRHWVRVELTEERRPWRPHPRLQLCFAGEAVVFGEALPHEERSRVATELRRLLAAR